MMVSTLGAMATATDAKAIPYLKSKIVEWEAKARETSGPVDIATQVDFFVLSRMATQIIPKIEEQLFLGKTQLESREYPIKAKQDAPAYF